MTSSPTLVTPDDFFQMATYDIQRASRRVSLLTLIACDDPATADFFDAVCDATNRGLTLSIAADKFTYAELGGHLRFTSQFSQRIKPIQDLKRKLAKHKIKIRWLGNYSNSLVTGRTHSKWLVIDDIVYTFGGVNMFHEALENTDYMIRLEDPVLAERLVHEQQRIIDADRSGHTYRSHSFASTFGTIYIDGGFIGDSIIYRRACELAKQATRVTYVSQYCPTGKLGRLLKKTDAQLYFNPWNRADSLNALTIRIGTLLSDNHTHYTRDRYLHAKCLIFELPDGTKIALTGSHNFSHGGVWLGTREITLETSDHAIISQLETFITEHVA